MSSKNVKLTRMPSSSQDLIFPINTSPTKGLKTMSLNFTTKQSEGSFLKSTFDKRAAFAWIDHGIIDFAQIKNIDAQTQIFNNLQLKKRFKNLVAVFSVELVKNGLAEFLAEIDGCDANVVAQHGQVEHAPQRPLYRSKGFNAAAFFSVL